MKTLNKRGDMTLAMIALAAVMMVGMFFGHKLFKSHKDHQDKNHSEQHQ